MTTSSTTETAHHTSRTARRSVTADSATKHGKAASMRRENDTSPVVSGMSTAASAYAAYPMFHRRTTSRDNQRAATASAAWNVELVMVAEVVGVVDEYGIERSAT